MRLKSIRWLIIPFGVILLMSHNSFAADVSFDAQIRSGNFPSDFYYCVTYAPTGYYTNGQCGQRYWASTAQNQVRYDSGNTSIAGIKFFTPSGYTGSYNDLIQVEFDIMQGSGSANNAIDISLIGFRSNSSNFDVVDVSPVRTTNNTTHVKALLWAKGAFNPLTPIILIPANVETANSNYYTDNFVWFREVGDLVVGGLVNVYHIRSSSQNVPFDDTDVLNSIEEVKDAIQEASESESEAAENIADQSPEGMADDGGSGENSQTTSLIGTLSSFLTAITNLSATNCNVTLAFPQFAGGSQTVNLCQNKEYTGNIVSIAGSIILVMFYLPVAFMLVSKIYSEIRSFTNG